MANDQWLEVAMKAMHDQHREARRRERRTSLFLAALLGVLLVCVMVVGCAEKPAGGGRGDMGYNPPTHSKTYYVKRGGRTGYGDTLREAWESAGDPR